MASDTRENILRTARRLFLSGGYTATSMRRISEEAGIGKATIYHHFPDKQSLVMALVGDSVEGMKTVLDTIERERDPRERIRTAVGISIRFLYDTVDILSIIRREIPDGRKALMSEFSVFMKNYLSLIADAIEQGTAEGSFRELDPRQTARVLLTMVQGTFATAYITGERSRDPEETARALVDVFFNGVTK